MSPPLKWIGRIGAPPVSWELQTQVDDLDRVEWSQP
jgi:hypothetical protein